MLRLTFSKLFTSYSTLTDLITFRIGSNETSKRVSSKKQFLHDIILLCNTRTCVTLLPSTDLEEKHSFKKHFSGN